MHNFHKCLQQFEDVRERVENLIPHLDRLKQNANATVSDGDQLEKNRRSELFR